MLDDVNCFMGTDSSWDFSHGHTLPLMGLPWGAHHWTPVNCYDTALPFRYYERGFHGLRLTHRPSPWMGEWCEATIAPQSGNRRCRPEERVVDLASERLALRPHRFSLSLPEENVEWVAAPSQHGAAMQFNWRGRGPRRIIFQGGGAAGNGYPPSSVDLALGWDEIRLRTRTGAGGMHADFALYLVARFDRPGRGGGAFDLTREIPDLLALEGPGAGAWVDFPDSCERIRVWMAASFIGFEEASRLLDAEVAHREVAEVEAQAGRIWNHYLERLEFPEANHDQRRLAASLMYRTLLYPRRIDEADAHGVPQHRCPDTGEVRRGVRVTDNGFWDTARTVYPWYSLFCPEVLPDILEGWLNGARSTGWMASWATPGHRTCMTGSYIDAVFADAVARGIDVPAPKEAFAYLRRHAEEPVSDEAPYGRIGLDAYLKHGFVPLERVNKSTARTLDYAYGDWCLARFAVRMGERQFAQAYDERSRNWHHGLCPRTGFFRGRRADGSWQEPFNPIEWGGPFVEGSAWQFAWHVPHHPRELIAARGGQKSALAFLQRLFDEPPRYEMGSYGKVIHEMAEMEAVNFGQYAHSNQPSHFTLPYFAQCGAPDRLQHWMDRVIRELYRPTPDGYCGDEDNGELSAWALGAIVGLFPPCPGRGDWLCLRPAFGRIVLRVPGRSALELAPSRDGERDSAIGELVNHADIVRGGSRRIG